MHSVKNLLDEDFISHSVTELFLTHFRISKAVSYQDLILIIPFYT